MNVRHVHPSYIFATYCNLQEPRPLPAGSSITHLFEYENWKTLEKYIETDVANYLQKLFGMLAELRAERLSQVGKIESRHVVSRCWCMGSSESICIHVPLIGKGVTNNLTQPKPAGRDRQGALAVRAVRAAGLCRAGPGEQAEQAEDVRKVQEAPRRPLPRMRQGKVSGN